MSDELIGKVVRERYRIDRPVGEGAMGAVYVATDMQENQPVAIKMLKEQGEQMRAAERFLREVQLLEQLVHPNVVGFIEGGFDRTLGTVFYAMEYLEGDSLARLTGRGRLPPATAMLIAREVAAG